MTVLRIGLAEEVLVAGAAQGDGAGAVVLGDEALEAADDAPGTADLVADEVGGGGRLVGDRDLGRLERAAAGVAAPAPVVERRDAGAADRDLGLAEAPGAAEAVGDDRRDAAPRSPSRISARIRRAEASGSCGQQGDVPGSGRFELSMPALAQTRPWWVSTIRTPRSARRTSRLSARISSTRAGSLPSTAASRRASAPGIAEESLRDPPLGLGDDLLRDDDDVAVAQLGVGRDLPRRPGIPSLNSGRPATGRTLAPRREALTVPSAFAVRAAAARARLQLAGQGDDVGGGVEVEGERGELLDREGDARPRGPRRRGGRSCPRRRRGGSHPGGARTRALVPVPWRSGTIAT